MTTTQHEGGISVLEGDWIHGGSETDSYISPWYVNTIKHRDLGRQQGSLAEPVVAEAVTELHRYTQEPQ